MRNFAAIDFEIANGYHTSICSVGVVVVRDALITEKIYRLIRPEPEFYWSWFTEMHGLCFDDTENAKIFPDVWAEIAPRIEGLPLVAHNSQFDEDCLKAVYHLYQMDYPDYEFYCTYQAARRFFGKGLPSYQLHSIAARCDFNLINHHHALADAEACAAIAVKIL